MIHPVSLGAAEVGSSCREPSTLLCDNQLAILVRGGSVTTHCLAAPALPTRGYQGDYRRRSLTSAAPRTSPLEKSLHISRALKNRLADPSET